MKWQAIAQAAVAAAIGAAVSVAVPAPVRAVLCPPLAVGSLLAGPPAVPEL